MLSLDSLNPQQRQAVETVRGPVLILAGAGTGKTRVITARITHLVRGGLDPANILAVTFTNKAAREMQSRLAQSMRGARGGAPAVRPTVCTFHSLCVRILRQHIGKLGYKSSFVIYDESEQISVIKKILGRISTKGEKPDPSAILNLLSRVRNGGERAAVYAKPGVRELADHVRDRYESALRACNAVDFDGLILLTLRLFSEHPEALDCCRAQYASVMVDEFQDTNSAQFQLVHDLTREHRNLCVVGDDDQSIYGWRGAETANLLDMEKHYPEVKIIRLEQNYRSTNTILKAANALIQHNLQRRGKKLWSQQGDGARISLGSFPTDEEEARATVEKIQFARAARRGRWSDYAILFRTNLQSRPLETALRQGGVPYHLIGGQSFFDRREIRDFLAYLKVFLNPDDDVSLLRIANLPARGLGDATMENLLAASHERQCSVFAAMKNPVLGAALPPKTRASLEQFVGLVERTRARLMDGVPACVRTTSGVAYPADSPLPTAAASVHSRALEQWANAFLDEIGYFNELYRSEAAPEAAESRIRNIQDLIAELDGTHAGAQPPLERLQDFLGEITLDADREATDEPAGDAVTLITMHSCKGLEFPHVYVVGLEDGLLPHSRSKEEGTLDEERRLFYVAITRAMVSLSISHCTARKKFGQMTYRAPSPFLDQLPSELIERDDETAKKTVPVESGKSYFDVVRSSLDA